MTTRVPSSDAITSAFRPLVRRINVTSCAHQGLCKLMKPYGYGSRNAQKGIFKSFWQKRDQRTKS
jgi:hypothetical protein